MMFFPAKDEAVSMADAIALLDEVERLQTQVADYAAQVSRLERLAHRDALVDLPNRRSFLANLDRLVARVNRYGPQAAVMFADVDGLKAINDRFGHSAGDDALIRVSQTLVGSVRSADLVARLAGDEFGILLEQTDELGAWQSALRVMEAIDALEFDVGQVRLPLSVAVGVAMIQPGDTPGAVLARADKEMYRIKTL